MPNLISVMNLLPDVLRLVALRTDPKTSRALRRTCKVLHVLITKKDLIQAGKRWKIRTLGFQYCWDWALKHRLFEVLRDILPEMMKRYNMTRDLVKAARDGDLMMTDLLVKGGVGLGGAGKGGPLYEATLKRQAEIVKFLLDHGVGVSGREGERLVEMAVEWGFAEIVELFLKAGVSADGRDFAPLMAAVREGHVEVAKVLFEHGAWVHAPGVLKNAAAKGQVNMVRVLMGAGADHDLEKVEALKEAATNGSYTSFEDHSVIIRLGQDRS
ncbi:hypothetical protein HDV00_006604 [Rhizophlyctis rosea]|nr:hypothetical protein HDV00_006604 [Rhizophlyctis rosea]